MLDARRAHFDSLFARDDDPWKYRSTWSEQRRFALMLAMLSRDRYTTAFEPACAAGSFTAQLATRCDRLQACDISSDPTPPAPPADPKPFPPTPLTVKLPDCALSIV